MKRSSASLVTYDSSDDDDENVELSVQKKRKLPPLSSTLVTPPPIDNPALHQGRIRTIPHTEGVYAAHIYVSLRLDKYPRLYALLVDALKYAKKEACTLCELWSTGSNDGSLKRAELHVSLSRPIYLRAHQREDLKKAVKVLSANHKPFTISFATFSELTNDEKTRTFLTIEVGAGHNELKVLSNALSATLKMIKQKQFYSTPRFHTSIAWALLDRPKNPSNEISIVMDGDWTPHDASTDFSMVSDSKEFPTIPHLPEDLIPTLNDRYCKTLASPKVGTFDVERISLKIGKEVYSWYLTVLVFSGTLSEFKAQVDTNLINVLIRGCIILDKHSDFCRHLSHLRRCSCSASLIHSFTTLTATTMHDSSTDHASLQNYDRTSTEGVGSPSET